MLHNSILIRDRLRAANQNPLCRARRDPHRQLAVTNAAAPQDDELALTGAWTVAATGTLPGLAESRDDLRDFLARCGVALAPAAAQQIVLAADPDAPPEGFRRTVAAGQVTIAASTPAGLWAGVVDLERTIALRGAAILPRGVVERRPRWPVQISQAPFGANYLVPDLSPEYLSDDAFRLLAHFGATGMTIYGDWLLYVRSDDYPELTHPDYARHIAVLRDAAARARRYGVRLYYVAVSPKLPADHPVFQRCPALRGARIAPGLRPAGQPVHNLCSSSPESLALHGAVMANLFREAPDLGGLILIVGGESYYHCFMRPDRAGLPPGERTNCPRCAGHEPASVVAGLLAATADAVHRVAPGVPVLAWPYSAHVWSDDPDQLDLIRQLPPGVSFHTEIDKDAWAPKEGYEKAIWDYSVDFTGPSERIRHQAAALRERGLPLFVKTETALGLECVQVPYVPALHRLAAKWANVAALAPRGVLQSWMFFGMWGSRAEELGWWANWRPDVPPDEAVRLMAERDFGPQAGAVLAAWRLMSEAAGHLPYIPAYFRGPEFIGPCHPLLWDPDEPVPDIFHAALYYLQENEATFATTAKEVRHALAAADLPDTFVRSRLRLPAGNDLWAVVVSEYGAAAAAAGQAYEILRDAATAAGAGPDTALGEELALVEYLARTWRTTWHTVRFLLARRRWAATGDEEHRAAMLAVARDESANARDARHLFIAHPWLNLRLRVDGEYPDSLAMLDAKLAHLAAALGEADSAGGERGDER